MLCAAAAAFSYSLLLGRLGNNLALPAAICMGGCVYLFAMWLMGIRLAAFGDGHKKTCTMVQAFSMQFYFHRSRASISPSRFCA